MDVVFSFVGVYLLLHITDRRLRARGYQGPASDHFDGQVFFSYGVPPSAAAVPKRERGGLFKWMLSRPKNSWVWRVNTHVAKPKDRVLGNTLEVTFVNHASTLIQTAGLNILTDPVWSKRVSPFSFIGPKRYRAPGIQFEDLPPIDLVLISHNHYDHMDLATLRRLQEQWDPEIIVPLGNAAYLKERGITHVRELDWWDAVDVTPEVRIVCAPGQHFSSRALSDRNKTLWSGYVIETPGGNIYFAGDTGYGPFVEKLKDRYQEFRLALLPIGAFRPEWFMGPVHISPDQALQIHRELNVRTSIGIHFATFHLADDGQDEPRERMGELLKSELKSVPKFIVPENGETIIVP